MSARVLKSQESDLHKDASRVYFSTLRALRQSSKKENCNKLLNLQTDYQFSFCIATMQIYILVTKQL